MKDKLTKFNDVLSQKTDDTANSAKTGFVVALLLGIVIGWIAF